MFSITSAGKPPLGAVPAPGPYETFAEAMASVDRFNENNCHGALTMLVLYGVRIRNGAGVVVWNPITGEGEYRP